jgi:hypothetical protein
MAAPRPAGLYAHIFYIFTLPATIATAIGMLEVNLSLDIFANTMLGCL